MRRRSFVQLAGMCFLGALPSNLPGIVAKREVWEEAAQEDVRFLDVCALIEAKMSEYQVPGAAFGLSKNGVWAMRGFGLTSLNNPQPVVPDTVFPIASISKTVAATAMMRLYDRGLVDIEAPVKQYISDFRVANESTTAGVRIWHLLTHTPGWEGQLGPVDLGPDTLDNFVRALGDVPALAAPGQVWGYNNAGWGVAGRVIEVVTGLSVNDALAQLVFEPLGLDRAFTRTEEATMYRVATGHRVNAGGTLVSQPSRLPANVPAGGCAMSLENLMRYALFHMGNGMAPSGEQLLTEESLRAIRSARVQKRSSTDDMGLGWHLRTLNGVLTAQHGGTLSGHCLHLQLVPERELCFAILTNSGGTAFNSGGWRLNEDVATAVLENYENLALSPNQPTGGNRGGNERMNLHAQPLETQPSLGEFAGLYDRAPLGRVTSRVLDGSLRVREAETEFEVVFYAPDVAYSTSDAAEVYLGMPVEFIRDPSGQVRWIRVDGRIARKL